MNKGVVFFFEGKQNNFWYCKNLSYPDHGVRGYVPDGCWWMDYNTSTDTVNVCIGLNGTVDWDNPINTYQAKMITHVGVPQDLEGSAHEIALWAKAQI